MSSTFPASTMARGCAYDSTVTRGVLMCSCATVPLCLCAYVIMYLCTCVIMCLCACVPVCLCVCGHFTGVCLHLNSRLVRPRVLQKAHSNSSHIHGRRVLPCLPARCQGVVARYVYLSSPSRITTFPCVLLCALFFFLSLCVSIFLHLLHSLCLSFSCHLAPVSLCFL